LAYVACFAAAFRLVGNSIGWDEMRREKVAFLLGAAAFVGPILWWNLKFPQPIEVRIYPDELTFTFTRNDYAIEFADLNGSEAFGLNDEFE
jgi:polyferredoxin